MDRRSSVVFITPPTVRGPPSPFMGYLFPFYPTTQPPKGGKAWGAPLGTGVDKPFMGGNPIYGGSVR